MTNIIMIVGIVLAVIVALTVQGLIAWGFAKSASRKGYDRGTYFWACFILGLPVYIIVVALPDRILNDKIRTQLTKAKQLNQQN